MRVVNSSAIVSWAMYTAAISLSEFHALGAEAPVQGLRPTAMECTLDRLDEVRAALRDEAPIPCDAEGNPS